jgi:arylamine N-acetyltransferase
MPVISTVTLADGQTTPVNHNFEVGSSQQSDSLPASWYDRSGGTFSSFKGITALVKRNPRTQSTKVSMRITDPTLDAVTGVLKHKTLATVEFVLPDSATLQNRKDILAYAKNILANASVGSMVTDLTPMY